MVFKLMQKLTCSILHAWTHGDTVRHSARPWYLNIHAIEFSSEMHCYFSRLLDLQRLFCSISRRACASPCPPAHILPGCIACKYVLLPVTANGKCCTGSRIYVLQLRRHLWFAFVHGMSSPSHHFPGNPMRNPQQLQVIINHWTWGHIYGDPSSTWGDPRCVLQFMFNSAALGAFSAISYNYFWSLRCEIL